MKRGKVGRKSFEEDGRAYKLFLQKLAERPGFDESHCTQALEAAYKETYRMVKPLRVHVKQRLLGFVSRYRPKILEDLELIRRQPDAHVRAPGSADSHDESHSSEDDEVRAPAAGHERRRRGSFSASGSDENAEETRRRSKSLGSRSHLDNYVVDARRRRRTTFAPAPMVTFEDLPPCVIQATHPGVTREDEQQVEEEEEAAADENQPGCSHWPDVPPIRNLSLEESGGPGPRTSPLPLSIIKEEIDISDLELEVADTQAPPPPPPQEPPRQPGASGPSRGHGSAMSYRPPAAPTTIIINAGGGGGGLRHQPSVSPPLVMYTSAQLPSPSQQAWARTNVDRLRQEIQSARDRLAFLNSELAWFQNLANCSCRSDSAVRGCARTAPRSNASSYFPAPPWASSGGTSHGSLGLARNVATNGNNNNPSDNLNSSGGNLLDSSDSLDSSRN